MGVMVESHLLDGRQTWSPAGPLTYGQSITDACIDWDTSVEALDALSAAVKARRGGVIAGRAPVGAEAVPSIHRPQGLVSATREVPSRVACAEPRRPPIVRPSQAGESWRRSH